MAQVIKITHKEISASAAAKLNMKADEVGNIVKTYADSAKELMVEKAPKNVNDKTIVETPLVAWQMNYHENGVKKNADGTDTKYGPNVTLSPAAPKGLIAALNPIAKAVIGIVTDVKKAA